MLGLLDRAAQLTSLKRETHAVRARSARAGMKSGTGVLDAAAPFKISRRRRPIHTGACLRERGVFA